MIDIANQRVEPYAERARVALSDGSLILPLADHSVDRVVSTYVLDLLSEADTSQVIDEAYRILTPKGKLCLVSLTKGCTLTSRATTGFWSALFSLYAPLVGGCRPVKLEPFIDLRRWLIEYHDVVIQFGIPSEVLIASPLHSADTASGGNAPT